MHALCPFCGGKPELIKFTEKESACIFNRFSQIRCSYCGATSKKILLKVDWDDGYDCENGNNLAFEDDAWKNWDHRTTEEIKITKVIVSEGIKIPKTAPFSEYKRIDGLIKNGFASFFKKMNYIIICPEDEESNIYTSSFAKEHDIPIEFKPINWDRYGKTAGYKRDKEITESADSMLAFWDGKVTETKYLIEAMYKLNKPVTTINL